MFCNYKLSCELNSIIVCVWVVISVELVWNYVMATINSRLIVKNLPKTVTEDKIRNVFSEKGTVTDVQLKYTSDGQFRGFAFVGFKTPEEAEVACKHFHKTYIGTFKIQVESCVGLGDSTKPRAWSKYAPEHQDPKSKKKRKLEDEEEEGAKKPKTKKKEEEILEKCQTDPEFLEFLESHRKKSKWGNDDIIDELQKQVSSNLNEYVEEDAGNKREKVSSKLDKELKKKDKKSNLIESKPAKLEKTFFTIKMTEIPTKTKKKNIKEFFAPMVPRSIRFPPKIKGIAYVGFRSEEERIKALNKHKSFISGKKIFLKPLNLPKISDFEASRKVKQNSVWTEQQLQLEKESEPVGESGRIFIRNLSYLTNEDEIRELFEPYGPVTEVHLPLDRITRKIKAFGFVSFMLPEHAVKAISELDGTVFQGRMLHLMPSKIKDEQDELQAGSSYKSAKANKLRKTAGATFNWNTLFLASNAVADVAAARYGLSKEELLLGMANDGDGKPSASIGVRMALAEAEIVDETRKFLEANGVSLAAFEKAKTERSKTCFLVKNLQASTTVTDLMDLFGKHGEIGRIVLPKCGITAIVEFLEPAEARAAFKRLAYTKFGGMPLYLEWAPLDTFVNPASKEASAGTKEESEADLKTIDKEGSQAVEANPIAAEKEKQPIDMNMVPELDTTLFVKNLNFDTDEETLKKHFCQAGPVFSATVARKKDSKHPGKTLSMGYGFVQFYLAKDVTTALKNLQGSMLQNHTLELKRSNRTLQSETTTRRPGSTSEVDNPGSKLLVRNVPFQTSRQEILDLFKTFGELRACRLPMKLDGSGEHRGFAFVEFFAEHEAKRAFETLAKSTHLYGRRLVIEWAAQSETVEERRQKTALQFSRQVSGSEKASTKKMMTRYFSAQPTNKSDDDDDHE